MTDLQALLSARMDENEISLSEAGLLINKLMRKSIPVVAYYIRHGVQTKVRGFVDRVTAEGELVVVAKQHSGPLGYLAVPIGAPLGNGCRFRFGDKREIPEETRNELAGKLGEAVLIIYLPERGQLRLFFNP